MRNTADPVDLAAFIIRAATSRTWPTVPGALSRPDLYMVWIESIITTFGFDLLIASSTRSASVSVRRNNSDPLATPSRSDRNLICEADSSPLTYSTSPPFTSEAIWSIRVDFPIPGSPPTSTTEPGTIPPPRTLSNSGMPVEILVSERDSTSEICVPDTVAELLDLRPGPLSATSCSTKEFHVAHPGHWPVHRGEEWPHDWQTYFDCVRFMAR